MKIVLCGGGTGGHITPLLAVANQLKQNYPSAQLIYIGERQAKFSHLAQNSQLFAESYAISAGKFRRYQAESLIKKLSDVRTGFLNIRDFFRFLRGLSQSRRILKAIQPDIIFIKGGFVGVPVGLAAAWLKIPYVTHDSDALPGLANRLIARRAKAHLTGMPAEFYKYPAHKTYFVGIPLPATFHLVTAEIQQAYRLKLNLPTDMKIILVTGGSLGARRLNKVIEDLAPALLTAHPDLMIIHQTGKGREVWHKNLTPELKKRIQMHEFISDIHLYSGAADLIISRAGATTLAEFAAQAKACIVVPNAQLTGGHQLKNAQALSRHQAISVIYEDQLRKDSTPLLNEINHLLSDNQQRQQLASNLHQLARVNAADELANLLVDLIKADSVEAK